MYLQSYLQNIKGITPANWWNRWKKPYQEISIATFVFGSYQVTVSSKWVIPIVASFKDNQIWA